MSELQMGARLRRRCVLGLGMATGASLLLAACGSQPSTAPTQSGGATGATQPTASTDAKPGATPLTNSNPTGVPATTAQPSSGKSYQISIANDWNSGPRNQTVKFGLSEFQKANPNIKVQPLQMGVAGTSNAGGLSETVVTQFVSGNAPDAMFGWPELVPLWNKYLADLSTIWKDKKADDLGIIDHPPITQFQGKRFAIDFAPASAGWLINVDKVEQAGATVPKEDWTWDEQLTLLKKLTIADGKQWGMWFRDSWDIDYWTFVESNMKNPASYFANTDETKIGYDTPEALAGFQWFVDFIYKSKVAPSPSAAASLKTGDTNDLFMLGIAATAPSWLQSTGSIDRFVKDRFKWTLLPQPRSPTNPNLAWHMGQTEPNAVSKDGEKRGNLEPAFELLLFFSGSDTVQNFIALPANRPTIPVKKSVLSSPTYKKGPPDNMALITKQVSDSEHAFNARDPKKYWAEWMQAVTSEADRAFIGEATAGQAWKSACAKTQKIIDAAQAS